jgi:hypothetical protein
MSDHVLYVYGITSPTLSLAGAPSGIDDAVVALEREGEVAALVSVVDATRYAAHEVEQRAGDVEWVGPRAVAHDAVLTWASDAGGVIPFPMFTFFGSAESLRAMLGERASALASTLARVSPGQEYTVRVFRLDAELAPHLSAMSEPVAALELQAREATPGQRYLLERKAEGERRSELRRIGAAVARETFEALAARSMAAVRDPLPASGAADEARGSAVLDASYLVARNDVEAFRRELSTIAARHEGRGFRFEFTGPWPPYHFVRDRE